MNILNKLALFGIECYQMYISPRKGYRCAYAVEYGGPGCSGAIKEIIQKNGIFKGKPLIQERFQNCREANKKRKKNYLANVGDCINPCDCDLPSATSCEVPSCDCEASSCEVSSCDCSF